VSLVWIVADSVRADVFGCDGGAAATPTVDRLAAEGARFDRVTSCAPWTVPSVAAMLTGVHGHRLGLAKWEQPWPGRYASVFDRAADGGVTVASFVFDPAHLFRRVPSAGVAGSSQDTAALLAWIRAHRDEEFLLFVHYWWTHIPYVSKPMTVPAWKQVSDRVLAGLRAGPAALAGVKKLYRHAVHRFSEEWLPPLLDELDLDRTGVLITADHGESWGEREDTAGLRDVFDLHGNHLFDEVLRVPLVVRPAGGGAGHDVGGLARTVDLGPTVCDLLGLGALGPRIDGISLADSIRSGARAPATEAIAAQNRDVVDAPDLPATPDDLWRAYALTTLDTKVIWEPATDRVRAYDLSADPGETNDLYPTDPDRWSEALARLAVEREGATVGTLGEDDVTRLREQMRRLGYTE